MARFAETAVNTAFLDAEAAAQLTPSCVPAPMSRDSPWMRHRLPSTGGNSPPCRESAGPPPGHTLSFSRCLRAELFMYRSHGKVFRFSAESAWYQGATVPPARKGPECAVEACRRNHPQRSWQYRDGRIPDETRFLTSREMGVEAAGMGDRQTSVLRLDQVKPLGCAPQNRGMLLFRMV